MKNTRNTTNGSSLIQAIRAKNLQAVIQALDQGADIEEADSHGWPGLPLRTACFTGDCQIVRRLLDLGANVNAPTADGPGAPLSLALRAGHPEIVELLLARGAEIPPQLRSTIEPLSNRLPAAPNSTPTSDAPSQSATMETTSAHAMAGEADVHKSLLKSNELHRVFHRMRGEWTQAETAGERTLLADLKIPGLDQ